MTLLRIEKAVNGYSIEVCVPIKPEKDDKDNRYYSPSTYSTILVKDTSELAKTIETLIPMLDEEYTDDDDFEKSFKEATK